MPASLFDAFDGFRVSGHAFAAFALLLDIRQLEPEDRAFAQLAADPVIGMVQGEDALDDGQPQTAAFGRPYICLLYTSKGNSDVQGKHKKQSGGAGQYGDVHIRFSPSDKEFEFSEELFLSLIHICV